VPRRGDLLLTRCRNAIIAVDLRVGLLFQTDAEDSPPGTPYNAEPHKCAKIAWHPMTMLPDATMPYSALGVSLYQRKAHFGTIGW
jgi:8-oxo-dGTP diphosphatase